MEDNKQNWGLISLGLILMLVGLILIIKKNVFLYFLTDVVALVILAYGFFQILSAFIAVEPTESPKQKRLQVTAGLAFILFAVAILAFENFAISIISWVIGFYQIMVGVLNLISYFILRRDNVQNRFFRILYAVFHLVFGLATIWTRLENEDILAMFGIYLMLVGLTNINDGRAVFMSPEQSRRLKRRFRFPLPVIFQAFLPHRLVQKLNRFIEEELYLEEGSWQESYHSFQEVMEKDDHILQVQISSGESSLDIIGHVNICYKDVVYSYGNHDLESRSLAGAVGDGVLAICDRLSYLALSIERGLTIVEYDLVLTDQQVQALEAELKKILDLIVPWKLESQKQWDSYAGDLIKKTNASLFKFVKSRYQTYYVFGTNCVLLADEIIGISGLDLFPMVGVLTPGSYFDYLNKEYKKQGSIVVKRQVFNKQLEDYVHSNIKKDLLS